MYSLKSPPLHNGYTNTSNTMPLKDCWNLAQTCQIARHASKIDLIWEIKILQTFGIDVKKANSPGPSARVFYQKVLYNYGVLIGLWQATTFGLYGGLFQVSFIIRGHT